jgi:hypothetical protein
MPTRAQIIQRTRTANRQKQSWQDKVRESSRVEKAQYLESWEETVEKRAWVYCKDGHGHGMQLVIVAANGWMNSACGCKQRGGTLAGPPTAPKKTEPKFEDDPNDEMGEPIAMSHTPNSEYS